MIKIDVFNKDHIINKVIIKGHALYDDYGKDIVCASVSSIYICTVNAILRFGKDNINILYNPMQNIYIGYIRYLYRLYKYLNTINTYILIPIY